MRSEAWAFPFRTSNEAKIRVLTTAKVQLGLADHLRVGLNGTCVPPGSALG